MSKQVLKEHNKFPKCHALEQNTGSLTVTTLYLIKKIAILAITMGFTANQVVRCSYIIIIEGL